MLAEYKMPFNYVQVVIAAFGAMALSVLTFFIAEAAGASMHFSGGLFAHIDFIHIVRFTVFPIVLLGFLTYVIGKSHPGICRIAQWAGVALVAVSLVSSSSSPRTRAAQSPWQSCTSFSAPLGSSRWTTPTSGPMSERH
ncbi:hypothetical protein AUR04nite_06750 [Glutamicibacter uratoxydans]|uniref:Uncharacterized protein n=1 Tax=Glutamicibacter uratoxydans TaxID=43667 RepID=A0A4Y4DKM3_GLUUR|nr:DUF6069 family protein [Glutamicibacter uratoxydans]GED05143.1 hypothetical protein AUR04nite_06750 [Glutamicibacter uratoxydans]